MLSRPPFVVDADLVAGWRLNTTLTDEGPHGLTLTGGGFFINDSALVAGESGVASGTGSRHANSSGTVTAAASASAAADLLGEITVRLRVAYSSQLKESSSSTQRGGLVCWGDIGNEADETKNSLFACFVNTGNTISFLWEHGLGVDVVLTTTDTIPVTFGAYIMHFVRRQVSDTKFAADIWVDGELWATATDLDGPSGGTASVPTIARYNGVTPRATFDDIAIYRRAFTEEEIQEDAGLAIPPGNDPPSIANVTPTPDGPLLEDEAIEFDVLDDVGLRRIFVFAKFPSQQLWEVIHDGTSFGPKYSAGSARTVDGTGYHYEVLRTGDWPEAPELHILPVDLSGEEPA